ncbi:aldo/keto reductase [Virgibacillus tibetensis]|uniref:aldo/keto reductase n=1 Tax=Virgibacillus tibetensis TaxID=3042313 RepID=UPI003899C6B8
MILHTLDKVDALKDYAAGKNTTLPNLALTWFISQEGVDAVIPGGKRKERIRENTQASEIRLSKEELNVINDNLNKN